MSKSFHSSPKNTALEICSTDRSSTEPESSLDHRDHPKPTTIEEKFRQILISNHQNGLITGCSIYQIILCAFFVAGICSYGWMQYGLGYYEYFPILTCGETLEKSQACTAEEICKATDDKPVLGQDYWIDESSEYSLRNLFQQLDLICQTKELIGWIGASYFIGCTSSCIVVPFLADKYGRKWIFVSSLLVQIFFHTIMIFSENVYLTIVMSCCNGFCLSGRKAIGFIYMTEFLTPENVKFAAFSFNFVNGSVFLFIAFYFQNIDKDWRYVASIGIFSALISVLIVIFTVPESPLWLLKTGKIERAKVILREIVKKGRSGEETVIKLIDDLDQFQGPKNQSEISDIDISETWQGNERKSTQFYLKQREIQINLALLCYAWSCASFCYYMTNFLLKYLPGDIYDNTYSSQISEIIAYCLGTLILKKLQIKPTFTIGYCLTITGGLFIIFFGAQYTSMMPLFIILAKFGICMNYQLVFIATRLSFPADFVGVAFGFCNFFSRGVAIASPQVAEIPEPVPMIFFTITAAVGLMTTPFLKFQLE